tara:strand:+ start:1295 stop:1519 length:225 start_codon:yes stop_codon:yes gene_type:complete
MLGAISPIQTFGQEQVTTYNNQSVVTPSQNPNQTIVDKTNFVQPQGDDMMTMVKKYAPYLIVAGVLYYLILKNK